MSSSSSLSSNVFLNTSGGTVGVYNDSFGVFTPLVTGVSGLGDIARSPINGQLFADTTTQAIPLGETNPDQFVTINTNTGKQTVVGSLGVDNIFGLEFASDGNLYGTSENGGFYTINTNTGKATLIAKIPNFSAAGDLVYDPSSQRFLATSTTPENSALFAISLDGKAKEIGSIGFEDVLGISSKNDKFLGFTRDGKELNITRQTGAGALTQNIKGLDGDILGATAPIKLDFKAVNLVNTSDGTIGVVNPIAGSFTPLFTGGQAWGDLALSPTTGQLFADTTTQGGGSNQLFNIDTTTGKSKLIGDLGVDNIFGLEFASDGNLYGTSEDGGFYTINRNTGQATLIAINPDFSAAGDLVYDRNRNEFLATSTTPDNSTLFAISSTDGAQRIIGKIGFTDVRGIQFSNGELLGYTIDGKEIDINPSTGAGTFIQNVTGLNGDVLGATSLNQFSYKATPLNQLSHSYQCAFAHA